MGIFDLKGSNSNSWNYADSSKPGYSTRLIGTVIEISNPQKINYVTKQPETWPDGNPKRNLKLTLVDSVGQETTWTFAPRSAAATACLNALDPKDDRARVSIEELLGKMIVVSTQEGVYNQAHPRPWNVQVQGDGQVNAVRGIRDLSQTAAQPQEQPQPAPQPAYEPPAMYDADIPF